jgi:protein-tyrosine phosphatase
MAEVVCRQLVSEDPQLVGRVDVTSAGTANWHVGQPMDDRARRALDRAGFDMTGTLGAFANRTYLNDQDIVVVMTREHVHEVSQRVDDGAIQVILMRNLLEPGLDLDLADPYYGDNGEFDDCLTLIIRNVRRLTLECRQRLGADSYEV